VLAVVADAEASPAFVLAVVADAEALVSAVSADVFADTASILAWLAV
jgi:hypothetical protein